MLLFVVLLLLIFTPFVGFCNFHMFYCALLCVHSSFAIVLTGKRGWLLCLVCLPGVSWLLCGSHSRCRKFCLQFVIVVFPGQTHTLFFKKKVI